MTLTGADGIPESVDPPNNNGYERTLKWTSISQTVAALTPFADKAAAAGIKAELAASRNPKSVLKMYGGVEHGVPMFGKNPELEPMIVGWLTSQLRAKK